MKDSIQDVLSFWFEESSPSQWFQVSDVYDAMIRDRFLGLYRMAVNGVCDGWGKDVDGCLALVLLFDQFSRNMFRDRPEAFSSDDKARSVARKAIDLGFDHLVSVSKRRFFYLPFEHSENLDDQKFSLTLFEKMREDEPLAYDYALRHFKIIERFARFPHRNVILGRESTPEELAFLEERGRGF
ncbi:MAG TPA: DUF924 family protein [Alphaproteobacteria bacterium]|nr:DUF924 family protein [Alphaproteobacteria bacterium]HNS44158.1 DUF924 family protein [Alphaproteobacteria bacterium]